MNNKRAIEIMKIEKECVLRQDTPKCDKRCQYCDLLVNAADVILAYDTAIKALTDKETITTNADKLFDKLYNGGY